jgi:hypothetical protein
VYPDLQGTVRASGIHEVCVESSESESLSNSATCFPAATDGIVLQLMKDATVVALALPARAHLAMHRGPLHHLTPPEHHLGNVGGSDTIYSRLLRFFKARVSSKKRLPRNVDDYHASQMGHILSLSRNERYNAILSPRRG